ncbi:TPA: restriction endonuclease subunit S, partial [Escherichia coli]
MGSKWKQTTLGDLALGFDGAVDGPFGSNLPAAAYTDSGYPIIRGSNLSIGLDDFKDNDFVFVPEHIFQKLSRSECRAGDIIFTKKGTLGQTGLISTKHRFEKYLLSSNQMRLRVDPEKALPEYVYYCVSSQKAINKIIQDSECTGVPKINLAYLKSFPISLPSLSEQQDIIDILGSLSTKITLNRQINQTLEQMSQTLFKSWFVDFDPVIDNALDAGNLIPEALQSRAELRQKVRNSADFKPLPAEIRSLFPSEFEETELGWVPKGWHYKNAEEIATISIGKTPPRTQKECFCDKKDSNYAWVSIKDLGNCSVFIKDSSEYLTSDAVNSYNVKIVPKDAVLLSFKLTIGRIAIAEDILTTNEAIAHFYNMKYGINKEYLYSYLKIFDYNSLGSTSSIATAINSKIIRKI